MAPTYLQAHRTPKPHHSRGLTHWLGRAARKASAGRSSYGAPKGGSACAAHEDPDRANW